VANVPHTVLKNTGIFCFLQVCFRLHLRNVEFIPHTHIYAVEIGAVVSSSALPEPVVPDAPRIRRFHIALLQLRGSDVSVVL